MSQDELRQLLKNLLKVNERHSFTFIKNFYLILHSLPDEINKLFYYPPE